MEVFEIAGSASQFASREEIALRITVEETDSITNIIPTIQYPYTRDDIISELRQFLLPDFNKIEIMTFSPNKPASANLSKSQKMFLNKLRYLVINNDIGNVDPSFEKYIDEFVSFLYYQGGFDDGENLTMKPCNLRMEISNESFATYADREGRRGTEIVWILCEDKHRSSRRYKKGETQMIACMIAAMQWNRAILNEMYPKYIIGIRVIGDQFCFYSSEITKDYLDDLYSGLPKHDLKVLKYPSKEGLSISKEDERAEILLNLSLLRKYAMELTPKYTD